MVDLAVVYSFCLYILYVLLPVIPALIIFKLFPRNMPRITSSALSRASRP